MLRKFLLLAVTTGLIAQAFRHRSLSRARGRRLDREAVQRWENEGGSPATPVTPRASA